MRKLQSGQIKTEPLDLDNPRKKQRLEESFNAATAPPPPPSAPAPLASPSSPAKPPSPQPSSTSPNRPPGTHPHFPLPNPFSTPVPAGASPSNTGAPSSNPFAPQNRPPLGGGPPAAGGVQKPRLTVPIAGGRENMANAGHPPSPHAMNGQGGVQYGADSAGYSAPQWGAAPAGPPPPLPSISGIITSLQQPSAHSHAAASTPSMPYAPPTFTVKQEPMAPAIGPAHAGYSMPPPAPPMARAPYAPPSSTPPPPFPTPPPTSPYTAPSRPYHPPHHPAPPATSTDSSFPALPAGLGHLSPTPPRSSPPATQAGALSAAAVSAGPQPAFSLPSAVAATGAPMAGPSGSGSLLMADDRDDSADVYDCLLNHHTAPPHAVQQTATT